MSFRTILDLYAAELSHPREDKYTHYTTAGARTLSTAEQFRRTAAFADALVNLGVRPGDRVMLLSENRPEWHVADLAAISIRAVDVPIYTTLTPDQVAFQARDSGAVCAVAENPALMAKLLAARERCPDLRHLVVIEGPAAEGVLAMDALVAAADDAAARERFWQRAEPISERDLATIIYTSGTTGEPKGAMLTHRNLVQNGIVVMARLPATGPDDMFLEFLPLCHVFERCAGYAFMARPHRRGYCAVAQIGELIANIRPTCFCAVPRLFEKVHDTVMSRVATAPPVRRRLFDWGIDVGRRVAGHRLAGSSPNLALRLEHRAADRLVLSKVRQALGGAMKYSLCAAAPLPVHVNEFFHALGIPLQEGYGLTETSPGIAVNGWRPGENRLGSVGRPLEGVEVKLAPDGELLVRGPNVMAGYWNRPEATAESFDADGFFRTGDVARIDDDGFVFITDRKKDLIVTAGGKNVPPQPIEARLMASPLVENAVLFGDGKPYIVALLVPNMAALEAWARSEGVTWDDAAALVRHPKVAARYEQHVAAVNAPLARFEQIKRFAVVPTALTVEGGQLTPTLKVRRRVVEREQRELIASLYPPAPPK